ncbi:C-type lectin domain family 10 member A-like [Mastacembelus armatus]|uniref:C-type lectin domain family 10 member A-like n=1 Tax=Mastacembelus armatus TaxID=205130 RepID=UPI000E462658|nr:C-type lectin domain family 10 member A-like [Mastacembelus armatus]
MSSDIYAKPDVSRKVRHNRREEEDGEWEEREVQIYETADDVRDDPTGFQSEEGGPHSQNHPPVQRKPLRGAAVCLGVLCLLMMVGIISLSIRYVSMTLENEQLMIRINNLSSSYNQSQNDLKQLQEKNDNMAADNSQLQEEVKKLKDETEGKWCPEGWTRFGCSCYFKSTQEKTWSNSWSDCQDKGADLVPVRLVVQVHTKISGGCHHINCRLRLKILCGGACPDMAADNSQLQEEVKKLKDKTEGKWCPEGWTRFGCSCYFKSTEKKRWYESRSDCQDKGADLVSINSKEEQEFVTTLTSKGQSWIGLFRDSTWKWVDGSPLTETFWATGHGNGYYGSCCDQQGKWTTTYDREYKTWICEK